MHELHSRALANSETYALLGTLESAAPSLHLLNVVLGSNQSTRSSHAVDAERANALVQCIDPLALPAADRPSAAQHVEVASLMAHDVALYSELQTRLARQIAQRAK